jgi:pyroglutamyl-peptidase
MLVIGFQGYGGRAINPAEEVVKALDGTSVAGAAVTGRTLPVKTAGHGERIRRLLEEHRPPALICLGLWPGEPMIRLERFGLNLSDFEIADNEGAIEHGPVVEGGALALAATLPVEAIRDRLLDAGIPARLSSSAGNFLCNATLYHALTAAAALEPAPLTGFVHLPYLPEQVAGLVQDTAEAARLELMQRADLASMALETQVAAVRLAAETTLEAAGS